MRPVNEHRKEDRASDPKSRGPLTSSEEEDRRPWIHRSGRLVNELRKYRAEALRSREHGGTSTSSEKEDRRPWI